MLTLLQVGVVRVRVLDSHGSAEERTDVLVRGNQYSATRWSMQRSVGFFRGLGF